MAEAVMPFFNDVKCPKWMYDGLINPKTGTERKPLVNHRNYPMKPLLCLGDGTFRCTKEDAEEYFEEIFAPKLKEEFDAEHVDLKLVEVVEGLRWSDLYENPQIFRLISTHLRHASVGMNANNDPQKPETAKTWFARDNHAEMLYSAWKEGEFPLKAIEVYSIPAEKLRPLDYLAYTNYLNSLMESDDENEKTAEQKKEAEYSTL